MTKKKSTTKNSIAVPHDYVPGDDEDFMNDRMTEYFRRKLWQWKEDILADSRDTIEGLQDGARNIPDVTDRLERDDIVTAAMKPHAARRLAPLVREPFDRDRIRGG
jgi:hypothetical protein